ncbi:unnamed protein product [Lasius platythorax]|uniref:Uncharacterized protein n=1 Tax=Lasius platythorax TaxID=488582 RepID=A0AAV2N559_9HYME
MTVIAMRRAASKRDLGRNLMGCPRGIVKASIRRYVTGRRNNGCVRRRESQRERGRCRVNDIAATAALHFVPGQLLTTATTATTTTAMIIRAAFIGPVAIEIIHALIPGAVTYPNKREYASRHPV